MKISTKLATETSQWLTCYIISESNCRQSNETVIPCLPIGPVFNLPEDDGRNSDEENQPSKEENESLDDRC